jgi:tetratricopeptide (TPR) repeat protein
VRVFVRPFVLLLVCVTAGGCATHSGGSLTELFVRQGKPSVDIGGPPIPTAEALQSHMRQVRRVTAAAKPVPTSLGTTVESSDPALAMALLLEAILPTADSHLLVAEEYRRLGILDAAYARLNRALAKAPGLAAAHETLARIWRDWGLPEEALGSAYRATYFDPRSASAQNTLGTVLAALGRTAEARRAYQQALTLDSTAAYALNNLCYLEFKAGRFSEARTRCSAAIRAAPDMRAAHNNLALVYAAQGDLEAARREFLAAGDSASAAYNVGIVHLAGGDYARAATAFEEAIRERPEFTAAKTRAHSARERVMTGH